MLRLNGYNRSFIVTQPQLSFANLLVLRFLICLSSPGSVSWTPMTSKELSSTVSPTVDMINRHTSSVIKEISMRCFVDERHSKRPRISPQERQRAPVACTSCRLSKIRCSSSSGIPCAHCRLKGVPCIIRHGQKGKYVQSWVLHIDTFSTRLTRRRTQKY